MKIKTTRSVELRELWLNQLPVIAAICAFHQDKLIDWDEAVTDAADLIDAAMGYLDDETLDQKKG